MYEVPNLKQEINAWGSYEEVTQTLIKAIRQGLFPDPRDLERMAASSAYGRYCAERVIEAIEADPELARRYTKILDSNIDFGQCG